MGNKEEHNFEFNETKSIYWEINSEAWAEKLTKEWNRMGKRILFYFLFNFFADDFFDQTKTQFRFNISWLLLLNFVVFVNISNSFLNKIKLFGRFLVLFQF